MHLETLVEDSMGTVCSQAPWAVDVRASSVCPIQSLLNRHYSFSDLGGWESHKQAFFPLAYDLVQPIRMLEEGRDI